MADSERRADDPTELDRRWRLDTVAVRAGRSHSHPSLAPVVYPATTYVVDSLEEHRRLSTQPRSTNYYSRYGSPSVHEFEDAVAALEGAESALAYGSGMAALAGVVFGLCSSGDHVVAPRQLFSVTSTLLEAHCPRFGIEVTFVDGTDPDAYAAAVRRGRTQILLVETPANPALSLTDIAAVAAIPGPFTIVDSTFATPVVQRPLELGADLVLHAATKGIAGHNDALLGVVAGAADMITALWSWHTVSGASASPYDASNALRGIRTLPARVRQQSETASTLATRLEGHPAIQRVCYPGLESNPQRELARRQMNGGGTMLSVVLAGGFDAARAFCHRCTVPQIALSLGGPETLLVHPASTVMHLPPAERLALGIEDGMVRVSVGLEDCEDLWADIEQALEGL